MGMNTIQIGKKAFLVPSKWEELNEKQALDCANGHDTPEGRLIILLSLASFRLKLWLRRLTDEQLHEAAQKLTVFCFKNLNVQLFPKIKIGKTVLKGIETDLADMKFIEFIKAENLFGADFKSATEQLCALIYRFEDEKAFDDGLWRKKTALFAQVSEAKKIAIARFYLDNREVIVNKYRNTIFKPVSNSKSNGSGWGNVFKSMIEKPADVESLAETNLHSVLIYLSTRK